jgi:uncharacterized protein (TIGR03437 family)
VAVPIDLDRDTASVVLVLYGTGIRGLSATEAVEVTIGGEPAEIEYAGEQGQWPGLDQVNVLIPRSLQARGEVEVGLTVHGERANPCESRF